MDKKSNTDDWLKAVSTKLDAAQKPLEQDRQGFEALMASPPEALQGKGAVPLHPDKSKRWGVIMAAAAAVTGVVLLAVRPFGMDSDVQRSDASAVAETVADERVGETVLRSSENDDNATLLANAADKGLTDNAANAAEAEKEQADKAAVAVRVSSTKKGNGSTLAGSLALASSPKSAADKAAEMNNSGSADVVGFADNQAVDEISNKAEKNSVGSSDATVAKNETVVADNERAAAISEREDGKITSAETKNNARTQNSNAGALKNNAGPLNNNKEGNVRDATPSNTLSFPTKGSLASELKASRWQLALSTGIRSDVAGTQQPSFGSPSISSQPYAANAMRAEWFCAMTSYDYDACTFVHHIPTRMKMLAQYQLDSDRNRYWWSFGSGLMYTELMSDVYPLFLNTQYLQRLRFVGVPLEADFNYALSHRWSACVGAGVSAEYCFSAKLGDESHRERPFHFGAFEHVGVDYHLLENISLGFTAEYTQSFTNTYLNTIRNVRPTVDFCFALRYGF